jgi:putative redox protein
MLDILGRCARIAVSPQEATMVRVDIRYEGSLRCEATHEPSGTTLLTDAPVDNHGKGQSFSPTDLVATALGTCMATIMAIASERHEVDLTGARVTVIKEMVAEPTRRIGRLRVVFHIPAEPDERTRTVLERAALACPVHASLHPDIDKPVMFRWGKA